MTKIITFILSLALLCCAFTGCTSKPAAPETDEPAAPELTPAENGPEAGGQTAPESSFNGSLSSFTTDNMEGGTVTEEIFSDYDVTMVNIWTTWCGFCIMEMPDLQKLYEQLPENVNLISVCGDALEEKELAGQIIQEYGISFMVLYANDELNDCLMQHVSAFPTTIFVDSAGNVIGDAHLGIPSGDGDAADAYMELINSCLESLGK